MPNVIQETAGYVIASLVAGAAVLPKILNYFKGEGINGSLLDRIKAMEDHAHMQDRKAIIQDDKIHNLAVRTTRLMVVIIRLEGLLLEHDVELPEDLVSEIARLKAEADDEGYPARDRRKEVRNEAK